MVVREKGKNKTTYGCITSICVFLDACFPGFHIHLNLDHGVLVKQSKSRTPSVKEAVHSHHKERKKKKRFPVSNLISKIMGHLRMTQYVFSLPGWSPQCWYLEEISFTLHFSAHEYGMWHKIFSKFMRNCYKSRCF